MYGIQLGIYRISDTRWDSAQESFASLLRVRSAVKMLVLKHRSDPTLPAVFLPAENHDFWVHLQAVEDTIRPLALSSFVIQRDDCTLAEVLHMIGYIYQGFDTICDADLMQCLEKIWGACEKPLYVLAYFMHPQYQAQSRELPESPLTTPKFINDIALLYYKRWLDTTRELCDPSPDEFGSAYHEYWAFIKTMDNGRRLATLALAVLSIAVNSATCERLFSDWGHIHTPRRNRLDPQKTKKLGIVRDEVRRKDLEEKT
ncbi:hypothetical protein PsorP6_015513 [Peronosclerospora sorghi]|uniref:Uncharacterized protein n=1 Tax=Peronosclerospora sorghi TaxID=230839 RepID=A0ACC0WR50_9STRA|nr:hypothetical protein PsorP6_015513 [Peronosclerospora sorghi]